MRTKENTIVGKFRNYLANKRYSDQTIKSYSKCLKDYIINVGKNPYKLNKSDLEKYLVQYNYTSCSQQNQIISSLRLFYEKILLINVNNVNGIERPRKQTKLPVIIDKDELVNKILSIENIKHRAVIALGYSTGMRISEVLNLKMRDIDSKRMVILVQNSKGNKDRYVKLGSQMLKLLYEYYSVCLPKGYLFNGHKGGKYSASSVNRLMKKYIGSKAHYHQLRHSHATHALESGNDITLIQNQLGHKKITTTSIYTHVSNNLIQQINCPI